jgi:hypothetical protein
VRVVSRLVRVTEEGGHVTVDDLARDAADLAEGDFSDGASAEQLVSFLADRAPDTWVAACREYAARVEKCWLEVGLFHEDDGETKCSAARCDELRAELDAIRAWPMPSSIRRAKQTQAA